MSTETTTPATTAAQATPAAAPAATTQPPAAETLTVSKSDWDRLNGTLGGLQDKERQREAAEKSRQEDEAKKRGEFEQLLKQRDAELESAKPYKDRYTSRVQADHERRIKAADKCGDKIKAQFRKPAEGRPLSLEDMEHNLGKLDEYEALGLLEPAASGKEVVVAGQGAAPPNRLVVQADGKPPAFDPYTN